MRLQFITYHGTTARPDRKDVHTLTHGQFAHQVELIRQAGVTLASASVLDGNAAEGYQLGITFDDGHKSDLANAELLVRHGMTAMFFISTARIGKEGFLDEQDIRRLRGMGMRIGSHSHRHTRLNKLLETEVREQLMESQERLQAILGEPVDSLAFPGGGYSGAVVALAREAGFRHCLTTDWGVNDIAPGNREGIYLRNNILASMDDRAFTDLITLRSMRRRRLTYLAKQWLQVVLPEKGYVGLRKAVLHGRN